MGEIKELKRKNDEEKKDDKKAQNLSEKLALKEAKTNLDKGIIVIRKEDMKDPSLWGVYEKYRYVHRSKNGTNITVHYHKHYLTWEVRDFKIKR